MSVEVRLKGTSICKALCERPSDERNWSREQQND